MREGIVHGARGADQSLPGVGGPKPTEFIGDVSLKGLVSRT